MKNVWILNHYALEPGGSGGTRHYSLAQHLLEHGWKSSVIAASVELNTGRQRLNSGEKKRLAPFGDVDFLWVRTPKYEGNGGGRMLNMLAYSLRVLWPSTTKELPRPDVIIGSSVHPFAALSGAILARFFKVPFVFEVRDLWPQTLIDMGRLAPNSVATKVLKWLEKFLYMRADRIIALLPKAADYIVPLGIPAEKIVWIPNGVEMDGYPDLPQSVENDYFTLMYFGAHGQANGLDNILRAMAVLKGINNMGHVRLRLIGDGPLKSALQELANELRLNNVSFEAPIPKRDIPVIAAEADAFVFNLIDAPVFRFGISSNKLFDFLAGARPIVFCCNASNNPVTDAGAGIIVPPGDPLALAHAIASLVALPKEQCSAMGAAGREYVRQNHGFDVLAAKLAVTLDRLVVER